ncbi:AI-2E family transporter [Methylobacterium oryzisoli]|uniref:AI-2E family transporter n=1 Tax=Methylobacterium oryzisoli TaxID=3385502 RepID=UPI0038911DA0
MNPDPPDPDRLAQPATSLDAALQIGLVATLIYACGRILSPLFEILTWSVILAVMLHPLHRRVAGRLGDRGSALLIGVVGVAVMLVVTILVVTSVGSSLYAFLADLRSRTLTVPPPPPRLAEVPLVGQRLSEAWALVATNAAAALTTYGPMLRRPAAWLLSVARGVAAGELSFVLSFAIAAALAAYGDQAAAFTRRALTRMTGSEGRGARLAALSVETIRGVALGVVGVAVSQSLLLGAGFFAVGLPAAGLLTLAALFFCIMQVPVILLTLPVIAYVFATQATQVAVLFLIWTVGAGLIDNILKPLLFGRGMKVPMPIILVGVIGGLIADGLLGLFIGPVLLATGYVLLLDWVQQQPGEGRPGSDRVAP